MFIVKISNKSCYISQVTSNSLPYGIVAQKQVLANLNQKIAETNIDRNGAPNRENRDWKRVNYQY